MQPWAATLGRKDISTRPVNGKNLPFNCQNLEGSNNRGCRVGILPMLGEDNGVNKGAFLGAISAQCSWRYKSIRA